MDENIRKLIFQAIDETISANDFERLQDALAQSPQVRAEYLQSVSLSETLFEIAADSTHGMAANTHAPQLPASATVAVAQNHRHWAVSFAQIAIAVAALFLVSFIGFWFGQRNETLQEGPVAIAETQATEKIESRIAGHATLRRSLNLLWGAGADAFREGDVLPDGLIRFDSGVAEIDFFCGATLIVEGPATLDVESDWSVRLVEGRLRANVPPAARGFVVKVAGQEIVDLGTEFALDVGTETARVEVIDGEVELRGGDHDGKHLVTGQRQSLVGSSVLPEAIEGLSTAGDLLRRCDDAEDLWFTKWKEATEQLRKDKRLIAYFPIANSPTERGVSNAAATGSGFDGYLVGPVERTSGRFGESSKGFVFNRPGARIRTRIDGEFEAFTFMAWVRIDSLAHRYNALFLADGYENGEPHWQIRDDGCLMFSVMVDESQKVRHFSQEEQQEVVLAGLHRVYYTEPFWDVSKGGQWLHLAAVYDPLNCRVQQYVNGKQISSEEITDKFHIGSLRIGAAEIGNWGQPFRQSPWFSVRNLNGTIDELAIFNAALSADEIYSQYEQGKPLGY